MFILNILMMARGKPKGTFTHPDTLFTQFLSKHPKTPGRIRDEIHEKFGMWVSWNTIHGRLDRLAVAGLVRKLEGVGRYNLYMIDECENGCEIGYSGC